MREVASPDVGKMGIEILSFTIKDVFDECHYLDSLGKAQTAEVKKNADVGVAEANRDAGIRVRLLKCSTYILCKKEHVFSTNTKLSKKISFLTTLINMCLCISEGKKCLVFRKKID